MRACLLCPADISDRDRRAKYCWQCRQKLDRQRVREWQVRTNYKPDRREYLKKWSKENAARKASASRASHLRKSFGLTPEAYDSMLVKQGGVCAICKKRRSHRLCVDHCHNTGRVRGLLCRLCNAGLGHFMDRDDLLEAAAHYLRTH